MLLVLLLLLCLRVVVVGGSQRNVATWPDCAWQHCWSESSSGAQPARRARRLAWLRKQCQLRWLCNDFVRFRSSGRLLRSITTVDATPAHYCPSGPVVGARQIMRLAAVRH